MANLAMDTDTAIKYLTTLKDILGAQSVESAGGWFTLVFPATLTGNHHAAISKIKHQCEEAVGFKFEWLGSGMVLTTEGPKYRLLINLFNRKE